MVQEIQYTAQLSVNNGSFSFPSPNSKFGPFNQFADQTTEGGGSPGFLACVSTGQGTLVDLSLLTPAIAPGGWLIAVNVDPAITVTWGPDSGGNLVKLGDMLPGEPSFFRVSATGAGKIRYKGVSGTPNIQLFCMQP